MTQNIQTPRPQGFSREDSSKTFEKQTEQENIPSDSDDSDDEEIRRYIMRKEMMLKRIEYCKLPYDFKIADISDRYGSINAESDPIAIPKKHSSKRFGPEATMNAMARKRTMQIVDRYSQRANNPMLTIRPNPTYLRDSSGIIQKVVGYGDIEKAYHETQRPYREKQKL
tara:strand:+ start:310 stop:816 length:507 start_codon:yes stop_codon:yes gene_type:complete